MFASVVTKRLDVPGTSGQWIEIRKLSWRKLRDASAASADEAYRTVRQLGKDGLEAVKGVTSEQIAAYRNNPASAFDPGMILRAGVKAWSHDRKVDPEAIDDLEPDIADWLLREILVLSQPVKDEVAEKNV